MMPEKSWSVEFSKPALKPLERPLEGKLKKFYRLRIGEYRLIFELVPENARIGVLAIVPRGRAY
jgi:mRNA-degrading endonuclease RelE of RelBE toxin-antitoxin system